jgi:hypothetical protein
VADLILVDGSPIANLDLMAALEKFSGIYVGINIVLTREIIDTINHDSYSGTLDKAEI